MSNCASTSKHKTFEKNCKAFTNRLRQHVKQKSSQQNQTSQSSNGKKSKKSLSSDDDFEPEKKMPLNGQSSKNVYESKMTCDARTGVSSEKNSPKKKNRKRKINKATEFSQKKSKIGPIEKFFPPSQNEKIPQANVDSQSKIRCVKARAAVNNDKCLIGNDESTTNNVMDAESSSVDDSAILMLDINNGQIDTDILEHLNNKAQGNEEDIITTLCDEKSPTNGIDIDIVVNNQPIGEDSSEKHLELPNSSADNAATEKETHIINNETVTNDTNETDDMADGEEASMDDMDDDVLSLFDYNNDFSDCEEKVSNPSKQAKKTQRVGTSTKLAAKPQSATATCIPKVSSISLPAQPMTSKQSIKISNVTFPNKQIIYLDTVPPISSRLSNRGRRSSVSANNMRFMPNSTARLPALMDICINNPNAQNEQTVTETPASLELRQSIQKSIERRLSISVDSVANQDSTAAEPIPILQQNAESRLVLPSFARNPNSDLPGFKILFPNTCRKFMGGFCTLNANRCQWEHFLPDTDVVRAQLNYLGTEEVYIVYDVFLLRIVKLFTKYFPQFCDYFGANNQEKHLIQMINDCVHPVRRCSCFFSNIIDGLMKTGLTFENAMRKLINSVEKPNFQTNNQLVGLILENHYDVIISFLDVLKTISEKENYRFDKRWIHKLMKIYIEKPNTELNQLIWSIVSKAETDIDQILLSNFMTKTTEVMAMNEIIGNLG